MTRYESIVADIESTRSKRVTSGGNQQNSPPANKHVAGLRVSRFSAKPSDFAYSEATAGSPGDIQTRWRIRATPFCGSYGTGSLIPLSRFDHRIGSVNRRSQTCRIRVVIIDLVCVTVGGCARDRSQRPHFSIRSSSAVQQIDGRNDDA